MTGRTVRLSRTLRWLFRVPALLYRMRCGWLLGHRFMLLVHVGRRSGLPRRTVLEVVAYRAEGPEVVVVSGFGPKSDWLRNLATTPDPEVFTGSQHFIAAYRMLSVPEAVGVIGGYEARNRAMAPVVRWVLSRLLGWRYRGSDADHRRMAEQLPFIAFRPRSGRT
jgi:deazaflavin-dependent oxidoreductase (nitroreductase family)